MFIFSNSNSIDENCRINIPSSNLNNFCWNRTTAILYYPLPTPNTLSSTWHNSSSYYTTCRRMKTNWLLCKCWMDWFPSARIRSLIKCKDWACFWRSKPFSTNTPQRYYILVSYKTITIMQSVKLLFKLDVIYIYIYWLELPSVTFPLNHLLYIYLTHSDTLHLNSPKPSDTLSYPISLINTYSTFRM